MKSLTATLSITKNAKAMKPKKPICHAREKNKKETLIHTHHTNFESLMHSRHEKKANLGNFPK